MQFNTYTYAGAHIACWLVNNPLPDPGDLTDTLTSYDVHQPVSTSAQARALRPWADRLRTVFDADDATEQAQRAGALLIAADCRPRLVRHGEGPFHLHYAPLRTDLAGRVKAFTAAGLAHLIDDGHGSRLGICHRASCGTAFIDTSRNGRRRFCSVRCANQVNVANHRARQRHAGSHRQHAA
jgi:predicted RNA-binding Zn ribbon-like protein